MSVVPARAPVALGRMPLGRAMTTTDELVVRAGLDAVFRLVAAVEEWPAHLAHYRWVRFRERDANGGGVVEMSANRPFGPLNWPTWWLSEMSVDRTAPNVRFRHIGGITTGMDVEWSFAPHPAGTRATLVHAWDGPRWPLVGVLAAVHIIGPVFVHGIASRTLAGLARVAERGATAGGGR